MKDRWAWLRRIEETLDRYGMPAWIASMVLGFVLFWPLGLAILGYIIWSERMTCWKKRRRMRRSADNLARSSGNTAFDEYREATIKRLEEEQEAFTAFLARLRDAKDRAEFDRFRAERDAARNNGSSDEQTPQPA
ncbi:MAG: DUF2852 domain-containing protein [Pseudomonadota bacterium]